MRVKRRWEIPGEIFHINFTTRFRKPLLVGVNAAIVADEIRKINTLDTVHIVAWLIMPDHVHLLLTQEDGKFVKTINRLKGRTGFLLKKKYPQEKKIWQRSFYERRLRSEKEISIVEEYILLNPVKAGYCADPCDWQWSSIH